MNRIPTRPRAQNSKRPMDFPLSVLVMGETAPSAEMQVCPYLGCARRLRWAPIGQGDCGLVCNHHGVVWRSKEVR